MDDDRIAELESLNKFLNEALDKAEETVERLKAENSCWREDTAATIADLESRLKDEARLLLAAKKVSEVAWIVGKLEAKGWTCMEDEHEAFAELSGAIEAAQASERKDG